MVLGLGRWLAFLGLVCSLPSGLVRGGGGKRQVGCLVGVVRPLVVVGSWLWMPRVGVLCGLGPAGCLVVGGCDSGWWMWLAYPVLCRASVGRPAPYGRRSSVRLPFHGPCALVWWCRVLSLGPSFLAVFWALQGRVVAVCTSGVGVGRWRSTRLGVFSSCGCWPFVLSLHRSPSPVLWPLPIPSPAVSAPWSV